MTDAIQDVEQQKLAPGNTQLHEQAISNLSGQQKPEQVAKSHTGLPELNISESQPRDQLTLAAASTKHAEQAEEHKMSSRIVSWGWTFDITGANGKSEGIVDQKVLDLRKTFQYIDENDVKQATGQERLFSWGTKIDVYDADGKTIGGIQEEILKSWWKPYTVYSIVDANGKEVAKSEKLEAFSTDFTLTNQNGDKIAHIHRPWLNFLRDNWTIDITKPAEVDKRILYMIPAYKTMADAERKAEEAEEERKKQEEEDEENKKNSDNED